MNIKELSKEKRHRRIRKKISGTPDKLRLCVFKSLNNIYAQLIDDTKGVTLVSSSTLDAELKDEKGHKGNMVQAKKIGQLLAAKALKAGIKKVVMDRGGYKYHGRIKALAEGAREGGLEF